MPSPMRPMRLPPVNASGDPGGDCEPGFAEDGGAGWAAGGDGCVVGAAGGLVVDVEPAAGFVSGLVVGVVAVVVGGDGSVVRVVGTIGFVVGTGGRVVAVDGFVGTEGCVVSADGFVVEVVDGTAGLVLGDVGVVVAVGGCVVDVVGTGGVVVDVVVGVGALVVVVVGLVVVGGTVVGGGWGGGEANMLVTARVVSAVIVSVGGVAWPSYVTVSPGGASSSLTVQSAPIGTVVVWSSPDESVKEASAAGSWTGTVPAVLVNSQVSLKL